MEEASFLMGPPGKLGKDVGCVVVVLLLLLVVAVGVLLLLLLLLVAASILHLQMFVIHCQPLLTAQLSTCCIRPLISSTHSAPLLLLLFIQRRIFFWQSKTVKVLLYPHSRAL